MQAHRNQLQEQLTAHENLVGANSKREMQMEKYKNALEAKNTESGKILDTFKNQIVGLKKGIYFSHQLIPMRDFRVVDWNF